MTWTFSDGHPKVLPACNFLSQYYFYNIFLQKSCRFSLQTPSKFEAAKTGSAVGFLRLTAVCNWRQLSELTIRNAEYATRLAVGMICPPPLWIGSPAITASKILNLTFLIAGRKRRT